MRRFIVRTTTVLGTSQQRMSQIEVNRYISAWSDSLTIHVQGVPTAVRIEVTEVQS